MSHFELQLRKILEMRCVKAGKGVAADIRYPAGETGGAAKGQPVLLFEKERELTAK